MTQTTYLSLGSNLGDRASNLRSAVDRLAPEVDVTRVSSFYETEPVGVAAQPPFLNLALRGETGLDPEALLRLVKQIETAVGRRPTFRWGPRVVDIDIVLYGSQRVQLPHLVVPHPRMAERAFVLEPLAEIAPDAVDPRSGRSVAQLLAVVQGRGSVRRMSAFDSSPNGSRDE